LKLAMAQKESEATQAYREAQLKISQQNADTSRYRAENPPQRAGKTPSATDEVNANLSDWLGGAVPPANTTPTTGESPNPLLPPPAADATTPPEAINKPETIPIVPATPTAPAAPAAPVSPTAPAVAKPDAQPSVAPPNVSPGLAALMDATAMQKPATPAAPPVVADAKPGAPLADLTLTKPDLTVTPPAAPVQEEHPPAIVEKAAKTMSNAQLALAENYVNSLKPGETPDKGVVAQWAVGIGSANANSGPVSIVINKMLADKYKKDAESKSAEAEKITTLKAQAKSDAAHTQQVAQAKTLLPTIQDPTRKAAAESFVGELEKSKVAVPQKLFDAYFTQPKADTTDSLIREAAPYRSDLKRLQKEAPGIRDKAKLKANEAQQEDLQKKIKNIEARRNALLNPISAAIGAAVGSPAPSGSISEEYFNPKK